MPLLNHALADRHLPSDSPYSMVQMQRAHAAGAIEHISKIFHALANNDVTTALNIEKTVLPHFTRNFFEEELKKCNAKSSFTANQVIESTVAARMILSNAQSAAAPTLVAPSQHISEMPMIKGSDLRKSDSETSNDASQDTHCIHENNAEHQKAKQHHGKTGGGAQFSVDPEDPKEKDGKKNSHDKSKDEPKSEIVLPRMKTYEQARNKALELIGEVDPQSGRPHIGNVRPGKGKIVGRNWHDKKVTIRIDYDPERGPHINVDDFRAGRGVNSKEIVIPFEGDEKTINDLINNLNTPTNRENAKRFFQDMKDEKNLARMKLAEL